MKKLIHVCFIFILAVACKEKRCAGDVVCTDQFVSVSVEITNENGEPVELDSAVVKNVDQGTWTSEDLHRQGINSGYYVIADDSDFTEVSFDGTSFQFQGWLDSALVVDEAFLIGRDCCHIMKLEGPEVIVVD